MSNFHDEGKHWNSNIGKRREKSDKFNDVALEFRELLVEGFGKSEFLGFRI